LTAGDLTAATTVGVVVSDATTQLGNLQGGGNVSITAGTSNITAASLNSTGGAVNVSTSVAVGGTLTVTGATDASTSVALGTSTNRFATITAGDITAGTTVGAYANGNITTGEVEGPNGVTLDSATGDINSSGALLASAGTVSVIAPQGSVVTGTIDGDIYVLNAESYIINGDLTNSAGVGSSVALYVDAALINSGDFVQLLTVTGTWTLAENTAVNVTVDGTVTNPSTDLPRVIASAAEIIDEGADVDTISVDNYFAEFDLDNDVLRLFEGPGPI